MADTFTQGGAGVTRGLDSVFAHLRNNGSNYLAVKNTAGVVKPMAEGMIQHAKPEVASLASRIGSAAGTASAVSRLLILPFAYHSMGGAIEKAKEKPSEENVNRAVGSTAFAASFTGNAASHLLTLARSKVGARGAASIAARSAARFVPGLNVAAAIADGVWATTVLRDKDASLGKKVTAGICAAASAVSASNIPIVSQIGAGISSAALIAHAFF
jgi:hypothetical protein